ncbi:peptidoglycan-binding domain-containing protein [Roseibium sp. SCP14]|uniref:peptidoglycan-binding domain-containing protein n=1 Tax=Roseibium sp. SCP14 TaxID=3141375 RepID=UPI003334B403
MRELGVVIAWAIFLSTFMICGPANAGRFVSCVQEQLADAGYDPGPIDGLLGRKTTSQLENLKKEYPEIQSLPRISAANASVYCRAIGMARASKVGWAEDRNLIKLVLGNEISAEGVRKIKSILEEVMEFYQKQMGVDIPGGITVVASADVDEVAKILSDELRIQRAHNNIVNEFTNWCRGYSYCGKSYGGVIAVSFSESAGFPISDVRRLLSHELAHEIQAQYVGNFRARGEERRVQARGPKWLTEALALALENKFLFPNFDAEYQLSRLQSRRTYKPERLRELYYQTSSSEKDFKDYSSYAGFLLVSKSSSKKIIEFWQKTPYVGWEEAFSASFGLTVEEFYEEFGEN